MSATLKFNRLQDKHVLLIGGSSGLGYSVAEASIEAGAIVTVTSSNSSKLPTIIASLKKSYPSAKVHGVVAELGSAATAETNIEIMFKEATAAAGQIHHVVFTAANKLALAPLTEVNAAAIQGAAEMRMVVPILVSKVAAQYLPSSRDSSITFTSGMAAEKPSKNWVVISFLAAGLQGLVRGLAAELAPLRVNLVQPGLVDTPLWGDMDAESKAKLFEATKSKLLTGEVAQPDDVAESYLWFMKDRNVTGQFARSEGGAVLL